VGECSFWYRPTRVVPDQRPLNGRCCCCCLLYADDILLVSHSLHELQAMLHLCAKEAADLDFTFNAKKSVVLRIGPNYNYACVPLTLNGAALSCVDQCKYLGIVLTSSRNFKCSLFARSFV